MLAGRSVLLLKCRQNLGHILIQEFMANRYIHKLCFEKRKTISKNVISEKLSILPDYVAHESFKKHDFGFI